ncbi:MAG TPA: VWA domain-containing protein [Kofleriaceae bacterium]|nr:VWA domain-containing protein [Kofleriaceae bacterium]
MLAATAQRVRTSLAFAGAAGTILVALLLHGRALPPPLGDDAADDGIRIDARLASTNILPGELDHDLAVTITTPKGRDVARPPLALAIVIDRSGSMTDTAEVQPLANAKAAAARLIAQLDGADAFTIVTYSGGDETVFGMARATASNKAAARAALDQIYADGGTCISCGLRRGASELAHTPLTHGVRRMVLISDGQGIEEPGELAQLAGQTAAQGVSISTVGVGLDFDEQTMTQIASVGRGNYYFVEDTRHLDAMFGRELGGLTETIATDARLVLVDSPAARIEEAYGYPLERTGDHVIIPIADLRAGEIRKVVLRVHVAPVGLGTLDLAHAELGWRRVTDGAARHATATARVEVTDDAGAVAASTDPAAVQAIEQALSARALEEASTVYQTHGADAARQVLEVRGAAMRANKALDPNVAGELERTNAEAIETFQHVTPEKAVKVNRVKAYQLAH